ncbi:MAG: metallophosphoesterase family protein [Candidatus Caldatribacteriaceae bacterium]
MRPLRILHTADWHLGLVSWRTHKEIDRFEEQKECLERLVRIAREEKVDLIIHAGDLFHQYYHPPKEAIQLASEVIMELVALAPFVWVIGNHDWYAVESLKRMFPSKVVVIKDPGVRSFPDLGVTIFPLPYMSLSRFLAEYPGEEVQGKARNHLMNLMKGWTKYFDPRHFHILAAHLTVEELAFYAEANATREVFFKRADFPPGFSYGAFGHLHGYTVLEEPFVICYPSSLVPENFKNPGQKGGFVIVDLYPGEKPKIQSLFFETSFLVTLDLEVRMSNPEILRLVEEKIKRGLRNYVRLRVPGELLSPEWTAELRHLQGEGWEVVVIEAFWKEDEGQKKIDDSFDATAIPELFARFVQKEGFSEEIVHLFGEYYHRVLEEHKRP